MTLASLDRYKGCACGAVSDKIERLDSEWDIERLIETDAALMMIASIFLGMKRCKAWFFISSVVAMFLLNHALQGWCPSVSVLRKMGVRTCEEIHNEKTVLKMLRGDFDTGSDDTDKMLKAAEKQ
jgi:hypothetical protein